MAPVVATFREAGDRWGTVPSPEMLSGDIISSRGILSYQKAGSYGLRGRLVNRVLHTFPLGLVYITYIIRCCLARRRDPANKTGALLAPVHSLQLPVRFSCAAQAALPSRRAVSEPLRQRCSWSLHPAPSRSPLPLQSRRHSGTPSLQATCLGYDPPRTAPLSLPFHTRP